MSSTKRQSAALAEPPGRLRRRLPLLTAMLIAAAAALAFGWQTLNAGFIMGDDQRFVTDHYLVNHPSLDNAWTLLTIPHGDLYQPLPMLTFQINYALASKTPAGVSPLGFHLTNVLLHSINAMLVVLLASALTRRVLAGGLTGLLFATHPMAMETIAWTSGRMILLATLLSLVVLILAVRRPRTPGRKWSIAIGAAWLLSLASKVMPTVPIVAWLLDRTAHRERDRRGLWIYVALFAIGAVAVVAMSRLTQAEGFGDKQSTAYADAPKQLLLATGAYLEQYVVPTKLSPWTPPVGEITWTDPRLLRAAAEVAALLAVIALLRKRMPIASVGLGTFVLLLVPFLFASLARRLFVADRYMYLPMIGLHLAVVVLVMSVTCVIFRKPKPTTAGKSNEGRAAAIPVVALSVWWLYIGFNLAPVWNDTLSYARRVVECYPDDPDAHNELARAYLFADRAEDALKAARQAADRWPDNPRLAAQIGEAEMRLGDNVAALASFDMALNQSPKHTRTRYLRALALTSLGRTVDARIALTALIDDQPEFLPAYGALAQIERLDGDSDQLRETLRKALEINPYHRGNRLELAMLDYSQSRLKEAEQSLRLLVERDPDDTQALLNLGAVLAQLGRNIEAVKCYDRLIARKPSDTAARFNRGDLLVVLGQLGDAEQDFRAVLKSDPTNMDAATRLHQMLVASSRWSALQSLWSEVPAVNENAEELTCYAAWAKTLIAFERHEPLSAEAAGVVNRDTCMGWIAVYARLREHDEAGLALALDAMPDATAAIDQFERQKRVIMSAFEGLSVENRNSRAGLYVAARLFRYFSENTNAVRFLEVLKTGDDIWSQKAVELLSRIQSEQEQSLPDS
ncbi:MAG: tetratricopeptide repeat protein [Phycisphaerales bacterium]|nr:tetratricopeptide repeat protein [Phycisphaerales bacterium]MCB9854185.1 tetratricopeptide repeat protein [Phycisphaerales bacterium]